MKLMDLIFGIRRDLNLDSRWWHRLAKVAFFVSTAALGLWWYAQTPPVNLSRELGEVDLGESLQAFMERNPTTREPLQAFYSLPGPTGQKSERVILHVPFSY